MLKTTDLIESKTKSESYSGARIRRRKAGKKLNIQAWYQNFCMKIIVWRKTKDRIWIKAN